MRKAIDGLAADGLLVSRQGSGTCSREATPRSEWLRRSAGQVSPEEALKLAERMGYLTDGRAVELSRSYFRGDTYDFVAELAAT